MGVTHTVDYKCHNRGVITELILHKHTCINRKVGVLDAVYSVMFYLVRCLWPVCRAMLQSNWQKAVELILKPRGGGRKMSLSYVQTNNKQTNMPYYL